MYLKVTCLFILITVSHAANAKDLTIAVASNFATTLEKLTQEFTKNSIQNITIISGSSGTLAKQISQGLTVDIFMSADSERPIWLEQKGVSVKQSRFTYAKGQLVLSGKQLNPYLKPQENIKLPTTQHIAIANPLLAPYGKAADECLKKWGMNTHTKIVKGNNINQAFHYTYIQNVDLGFIALSQAIQTNMPYLIIDSSCHKPINQQAVLIKKTDQKYTEANKFMRYLKSAKAKQIIQAAGYQ